MNKVTKKDKAKKLFEENHNLPYTTLVRLFLRELDLPTENAARTYISMTKRELAHKLNISYKGRKIDARKTKKGKAMELFKNNTNLTRNQMIELFVEELDMTWNSAATHCSMCVQEYVGPKHKTIA